MKCPKAYETRLSAQMDAAIIHRKSSGKQEPVPYQCHRCKAWHLRDTK